MSEEILINGKKITELSDMFFEYCELKKETERMQQELDIKEKMLDKFMIGSGETLEKLQKENEGLKKKNKELLVLSNKGGALLVAESTKNKKYEQALEEIRENIQNWINSPWFCFNCRNNMDERLKEMKSKIDEVLNEQK